VADTWLWVAFSVISICALVIDLGIIQRKARAIAPREAAVWSAVWVGIAAVIAAAVFHVHGRQAALEFATGYIIELSLSVDNIFVFVLIFTYFRVPAAYQHRVLFWGIVGAVVLRAAFIFGGIVLLRMFHWLVYPLGAILIWGGIQILRSDEVAVDPEQNRLLRLFRRFVPMLKSYDGARFFSRREGRLLATPMMAVLIAVETTDIVFALDSIPAVLAITQVPFLVFSSNICAVLGLRSFYFLFVSLIDRLRFLRYGLAIVLCFVGVKMASSHFLEIPVGISLAIVASLLGASVVASMVIPAPPKTEASELPPGPSEEEP
jgi:tellurite resistance protein TerC